MSKLKRGEKIQLTHAIPGLAAGTIMEVKRGDDDGTVWAVPVDRPADWSRLRQVFLFPDEYHVVEQ